MSHWRGATQQDREAGCSGERGEDLARGKTPGEEKKAGRSPTLKGHRAWLLPGPSM